MYLLLTVQKKCRMKEQRWKGSLFLTQTCMGVPVVGVTLGCTPIHLGRHRETSTIQKVSPKPIQACRSFPNIALFQTHTHAHTQLNEKNKQIKNWTKTTRRTKSEQHKQDQSAGVFDKKLCIDAIRCFQILRIVKVPIRCKILEKNKQGKHCFLVVEMSNQRVSNGALLSLGLRSANGPGAEGTEWMRFPHRKRFLFTFESQHCFSFVWLLVAQWNWKCGNDWPDAPRTSLV